MGGDAGERLGRYQSRELQASWRKEGEKEEEPFILQREEDGPESFWVSLEAPEQVSKSRLGAKPSSPPVL